jgi:gas vesicle protein
VAAAHNNNANIIWEDINLNNNSDLLKGMGIGIVAGLSIGMIASPRRNKQNVVGKALRVAGDLADNISTVISR